jgi:hypothetical protein
MRLLVLRTPPQGVPPKGVPRRTYGTYGEAYVFIFNHEEREDTKKNQTLIFGD